MSRETLPQLTDRLNLGPFRVSPFCLGIVREPEIVLAAYDAGINFFFITADMHWPAYTQVRRGLEMLLERGGGIRDDIVLAAVSYTTQPEFCTFNFMELFDEIRGVGRIDVLVAGGAYQHELKARLPVYQRNRDQGLLGARSIGASFHDRPEAARQATSGAIDIAYVRYNTRHPGAREDLFPHVRERRALLYNFTNTSGHVADERYAQLGLDPETWRPSVADHYRYVLTRPELDGVLCGITHAHHIEELVDALGEGPLDADEEKHLELLTRLDIGASELVT